MCVLFEKKKIHHKTKMEQLVYQNKNCYEKRETKDTRIQTADLNDKSNMTLTKCVCMCVCVVLFFRHFFLRNCCDFVCETKENVCDFICVDVMPLTLLWVLQMRNNKRIYEMCRLITSKKRKKAINLWRQIVMHLHWMWHGWR